MGNFYDSFQILTGGITCQSVMAASGGGYPSDTSRKKRISFICSVIFLLILFVTEHKKK